jgi:hypothetical protein
MMTDEDILAEFRKIPAFGTLGSNPFVIRIDKHTFINIEVTWREHSFYLRLAEAFPGPNGPVIEPETKPHIEKQVREFVETHQTEEPPIASPIV